MKPYPKTILLLICLHWAAFCFAQPESFNFHHLTTNDGLNDGVVRAIGQDKYGYIWIGTVSGLSRYNGYSVKIYQNVPGDPTSFPPRGIRSILGDAAGNLWIGCTRGLYKFDYNTSGFHLVNGTKDFGVTKIIERNPDTILLATSQGLSRLIPSKGKIIFYDDHTDSISVKLLHLRINDFSLYGQFIYLATDSGLVLMNMITRQAKLVDLPPVKDKKINRVVGDTNGNLWATFGFNDASLLKTNTSFSKFEVIDDFYYTAQKAEGSSINDMFVDAMGHLWLTTTFQGLISYDEKNNRFNRYMNDPSQQGSICANHIVNIFQDREGLIWIGSEGYGVDYFNPEKIFFKVITCPSILPPSSQQPAPSWARTITEDQQGNLWMGWGGALIKMGANGQLLRLWQNVKGKAQQIQYNSIRSLLCDDKGDIWICTTDGVNRFRSATGKMEFLDEKDSLPPGFYWSVIEDNQKNIWIGERSNLYYYDAAEKKFHTAASHPILSRFKNKGVHCIMQDSKHRLWFGMNGAGLVEYDPQNGDVKSWMRTDDNDTTIIGNTITSIAEDKKGIIWVSSFIGMVSYDPEKNKFTQYTRQNGLSSIKTSCLMVDNKNRLWIGTTSGLMMLDSSRQHFKNFDLHDGLPTLEFNDQDAYRMKNGSFVFPSLKGFVVFDANAYEENIRAPELYLSSLKVHNNEITCNSAYEELKQLDLHHDENFFSFELAALNYSNPQQTWYAYKLEPFDKDWVYTKNRAVNYTNVPGGNYLFRYKATVNPSNWDVPEKILQLHIGTVFYKAVWFWPSIVLLTLAILYWLYRIRLRQQQRIYLLQSKANALEKEKALVMYESLKQQLNPHFLFNSLTSLSSLIRINQKAAGEFLDSLSKIYRYILKSRDNEVVPLGDELKFAETFIKLQKTRFEKGLKININVDEEYYHQKIAPVTLQHLIENAIKHNIIDDEAPLCIDILVENDCLVIRNNLQRKNFVETSNKQGLQNLQSLYHYLTPHPVEINEDEKFFTVKIPLI